jgi:hypothetical protein
MSALTAGLNSRTASAISRQRTNQPQPQPMALDVRLPVRQECGGSRRCRQLYVNAAAFAEPGAALPPYQVIRLSTQHTMSCMSCTMDLRKLDPAPSRTVYHDSSKRNGGPHCFSAGRHDHSDVRSIVVLRCELMLRRWHPTISTTRVPSFQSKWSSGFSIGVKENEVVCGPIYARSVLQWLFLGRRSVSSTCSGIKRGVARNVQMETVADVMTKKDLCVVGPDTSLDDGEPCMSQSANMCSPSQWCCLTARPSRRSAACLQLEYIPKRFCRP